MKPTTSVSNMICDGLLISSAGVSGMLVDVAHAEFSDDKQERFWALASALRNHQYTSIREVVPGVNNLLVVYNPLLLEREKLCDLILKEWAAVGVSTAVGRDLEIPVVYGGVSGEDLPELAKGAGLGIDDWVARHSQTTFRVACLGSMPGFAFLTGLPHQLASPRRAVPRTRVHKGSVIIGGAQAGVMPCSSPSGWHLIGQTELSLFDPERAEPCVLMPGDRVRFINKGIDL